MEEQTQGQEKSRDFSKVMQLLSGMTRPAHWLPDLTTLFSHLKMIASISVRGNYTRTNLTNLCFSRQLKYKIG